MDALLEAATRVFRREGWRATTNRIAREAGVSIGSLYEYFPDKQALLLALAERHVELAEIEIERALATSRSLPSLLAGLQRAIVTSQRFPSEALTLIAAAPRESLAARAAALRTQVLSGLAEALVRDGSARDAAELKARAAFGAIGDLSVRIWLEAPSDVDAQLAEVLAMAVGHCVR